ncbi:hypothetical protein [Shewanella sp. 125m-1]
MKAIIAVTSLFIASISTSFANELTVNIMTISEEAYHNEMTKRKPYPQPTIEKITDQKQLMASLSGRLVLDGYLEIKNSNAERIIKLEHFDDECLFNAYYPQEQSLYFTCGHESDTVISMVDGRYIDETPELRIYSPDGKYRLSGYYNGQEPSSFIQKKVDNQWVTMSENAKPADESSTGYYLYFISEFTWITDRHFVFKNPFNTTFYMGDTNADVAAK